ncbi:hypothetical protein HHK36_009119 [Tetracentron sinense]|uniref:Uncharacterized protein n=1 Tax=Tetracentron sinense TaxID=13715 RepID=A0A835DKR5_TETSI|nr:hypothetical protein HHK36_009119 [Tetracentron sinense]
MPLYSFSNISSLELKSSNAIADLLSFHDPLKANSQRKMSDFEASPTGISRITEKHCMPVFPSQNASVHCFLFGADFVSVDAVGKVLVASVPLLPFMKNALLCKSTGASTELPNCMKEGSFRFSTSPGDCNDLCMPDKSVADLTNSPQKICIKHESVFNSRLCNSDAYQEQKTNAVETIFLQTPILKQKFSNLKDSASGTPDGTSQKTPISLDDEGSNDFRDNDLSPRLTNMIKEGVVPESPIGDTGHDLSPKDHIVCVCLSSKREDCGLRSNCHTCVLHGKISAEKTLDSAALSHIEGRNTSLLNHVSPAKLCIGLSSKGSSSEKNEKVSTNNSASGRGDISASCVDEEIHTPSVKMNNSANTSECIPGSPIIKDFHTPLVNLTNHSCSRDWYLSSGETSKTVHRAHNFKRLRKYGDSGKRMYSESMKENFNIPVANLTRSFTSKRSSPMTNRRGSMYIFFLMCNFSVSNGNAAFCKRKPVMDVKSFIEEEAEVSSDAEVSDDEDDDKDNNSYDDSFIDDRLNPTAASTQLEAGRSDMMAIYRRSLLSQSPVESQPNCYTEISPDSLPPRTKSAETGSCSSGRISSSLQTPGTDVRFANQSAGRNSDICQMDSGTISLVAMPGETSGTSRKNESKMDSRKRKLFYKVGYVPAISLDQEWLSEDTGKASMQGQAENGDVFYDDQFYAGLDLDAMEAQATKLLRYKSESTEEKGTIPNPTAAENLGLPNSPSFDLGI